jgi:hypothetical protein
MDRISGYGPEDVSSNLTGTTKCYCGGIGRHEGLKIPCSHERAGSSPVSSTKCPRGGTVDTLV